MNLPTDEQRLSIIGPTGSGKTVAAVFHLSLRGYDRKPWVIYNFKDDKNIDGIPHARHIGVEEIPIRPGVYIVHPKPHENDEVENQMWEIWARQNIGVYVDEGYMLGNNNRAFRALLTQGRSRQIPIIVLSQRPVWMDRFVFSESEFFQVFSLRNKKDIKNVEEFVPATLDKRLPQFHSYYYDVGADAITILKPVPSIEKIHASFEARLKRLRKVV
jgi:hypothetical protein